MSVKSENAQAICDYLLGEGYRPEIDDDGDVRFKKEGAIFCVCLDKNDDEFYKVILVFGEDENLDPDVMNAAMVQASAKTKVGKIFSPDPTTLVCSVEAFYASVQEFLPNVERFVGVCRAVVHNYQEARGNLLRG